MLRGPVGWACHCEPEQFLVLLPLWQGLLHQAYLFVHLCERSRPPLYEQRAQLKVFHRQQHKEWIRDTCSV